MSREDPNTQRQSLLILRVRVYSNLYLYRNIHIHVYIQDLSSELGSELSQYNQLHGYHQHSYMFLTPPRNRGDLHGAVR